MAQAACPEFTFRIISSCLGEVGLVQRGLDGALLRVFLPRPGMAMREAIAVGFPGAVPDRAEGDALCNRLGAYLAGTAVAFSLDGLDFIGIGGFARRVLEENHTIPRGRVMTYGGLALRLGIPGAGRAVGSVMARNPFPLIIPCHRVVGSGGCLQGFGGGLPMKRALLAMEGVGFDGCGRVLPVHILTPCPAES